MVAVGWPREAVIQCLNIILSALIHMPDERCKTGNKPFYGWLILLNILWSGIYFLSNPTEGCCVKAVGVHAVCLINHITRDGRYKDLTLYEVCFFTWFFKFFVDEGPRFRDSRQAFLHGLDVRVGTVALWKFRVTVAPTVIVSANKGSLSVAGDITESCFHESVSEIIWQNDLQPYSFRGKESCYKDTGAMLM